VLDNTRREEPILSGCSVRLSFCIPTYNRADFIRDCLDSILAQWQDGLEIVIVDGASTDATPDVVAEYQRRYPFIRYYRRQKNVGIDEDVLKVIELATGDYCWMMSDDDRIEAGALARVLSFLDSNPSLAGVSLNYVSYDKTLSYQIYTAPAGSGGRLHQDIVFDNRDTCYTELGVHLGYLSTQVIDRRLWNNVICCHDISSYTTSAWLIVYVIGLMLAERPRWGYIHYPCVANRSANDSFITRVGGYQRQLIAHVTFDHVISGLFGYGQVRRNVFKTLIADRMPKNLASYKANGATINLQLRLVILYVRRYWSYPAFWWKVFPIFFMPNHVLSGIRRLYLRLAQGKIASQP
jgi:abequosyltransferase